MHNSDPQRLVESLELLSKTCTDICEGQWMDMNFATRKDVTEEEYMRMVEKKTAVLFATALKMGASLSAQTAIMPGHYGILAVSQALDSRYMMM